MTNKKRFARKFKRVTIKLECIVKFHKLLDKHPKFAKSNMRLRTLHAKTNMRLTILLITGVIIPDPNTMKSNAMAS